MAVPRAGLVLGVDFGTLSGRAVVGRTADRAESGSAVHEYRYALLADVARDDYRDVLRIAVPTAQRAAGADRRQAVSAVAA
jgi:L-ribulokinase